MRVRGLTTRHLMLLGRISPAETSTFAVTHLYNSMLTLSIARLLATNLSNNLVPWFDKPVLSATEGLTMSGKNPLTLSPSKGRLEPAEGPDMPCLEVVG